VRGVRTDDQQRAVRRKNHGKNQASRTEVRKQFAVRNPRVGTKLTTSSASAFGRVKPASAGALLPMTEFDPDHHFLLTYELLNHNIKPQGFSGGGIWRYSEDPSRLLWSPSLSLGGLLQSYYPTLSAGSGAACRTDS